MFYNLKESTLQLDNTSLDYAVFGKGTKPLVIIPGLTLRDVKGAGWSLAYMYRIFAKDYRVYIFDKKKVILEGCTIKNLANKYLIDRYENVQNIEYDKVLSWVQRKIETYIEEYQRILFDGELAGYYRFH